jgi:serine/threonine-protein kinase RsbW
VREEALDIVTAGVSTAAHGSAGLANADPDDEGTGRVVELDFPARPDYLALARQVVVASARTEGAFGEERLEDLRLAVSEACTNAIRAHRAIGSDASIHIRCRVTQRRIEVEVVDHGAGFDPERLAEVPSPGDPERLHFESGLGIPLMQLFTDLAEIRSSPSGTNVRLVMLAMPVVGG